jgi:predicted metalloenzyme YecM
MGTRPITALDIPRNDWEHILKVLRTCAESGTFERWFAPIRFVSANEKEIRVSLPSDEFRKDLLEHHENMINYGKSCAGLHDKRITYLAESSAT